MVGSGAIRAVLFDAAGTLIETREPVGDTYARVARRYGVELPGWRLDDAFRRILRQAPPRVFPGAAPPEVPQREREWWRAVVRSTFLAADSCARFRDFDACFDELFRTFAGAEAWRCREGAAACLRALRRRGVATGVVSNFDHRLPALLASLGLAALLDGVVLAADAGAEKPDPRIFARALTELGVDAAGSVFVGDSSERDVAGARGAGLRAIDVTSLATLSDLPELLGPALPPEPEPQ